MITRSKSPVRMLPWALFCMACATPPAPTGLAKEQLTQDFQVFRNAFEEGHPGLYRYSSKADMDHVFERASEALSGTMTLDQFYRVLSKVTAAVNCGHTRLLPTAEMTSRLEQSEFPFDVRVIDGRVYILHDYSTEDDRMKGSEVLSVNGHQIDQLLGAMLQSVEGDGRSATQRGYRLGHDGEFAGMLKLICEIHSPFQVKLRRSSGEVLVVGSVGMPLKILKNLAGRRYGPPPSPLRAATLTFMDEDRIGILTVYGFGGMAGLLTPLNRFFDNSFRQLSKRATKSLILDLRDHDGGQPELGEQVFSYLASEPFLYYKDLILNARSFSFFKYADSDKPIPGNLVKLGPDAKYHHTAHANWGIQQVRQPHFGGDIFMMLNGGSFSVTAELLAMAKSKTKAKLIGEESGGVFSGNTSGMKYDVKLPNSKIVLRVPVVAKYLAVDESKQPMDRGVIPDYPVHYSIGDLVSGMDKEMAVALELARKAH